MTEDFYCDEALSGRTPIDKVIETPNVLAFHHTRPFWPVHIVVVPKRHIGSLLTLEEADNELLIELFEVIKQIAARCSTVRPRRASLASSRASWVEKARGFSTSVGTPCSRKSRATG